MDTYYQTLKARSNVKILLNTPAIALVRNGAQITGVRTSNTAINGNGVSFNLHGHLCGRLMRLVDYQCHYERSSHCVQVWP